MTVSSLARASIVTTKRSRRVEKICKFTPHYMVAAWSGETCATYFRDCDRDVSANYCIGVDGGIVCNVPEEYRAWTTSSNWNDQRAITVECGNLPGGQFTAATWESLVALAVDVCQRYGFRLHWTGGTDGTLTAHYMYASTDCPGPWMRWQLERFAAEVNARLDGGGTVDYSRINRACAWADSTANDPSHGYTQGPGRCGPTDYDCSGFVGKALEVAGYDIVAGPDTASLPAALERAGFRRRDYVPGTLRRGSVEIRPKTASRSGHVAICIDSNLQVISEAYINENGGITGGRPGDQTGNEIRNHADWEFGTYIYDPPEYFEPAPAPKPKPTVVPKKGPDEVINMAARQGEVTRLYNPYNGDHVYTTDPSEARALVKAGYQSEGPMGTAPRGLADLHRFYNVDTGEHLLTDDLAEAKSLLSQGSNLSDGTKRGWQYEGVAFIAYADDRGTEKIHRMYKKGAPHLLTSDANEVRELKRQGWTDEGVKFSLDA